MMKKFPIILFLILITNASCKKGSGSGTNPILEQYFETSVLNSNFIVSLAQDNGTDLTADYNGYVFVLLETDLYHGPLQAKKNGTVYTGTWSSNNDYSKLVITLPNPPAEFGLLSRAWRFTSKNLPTLALAPWGSSAPIVLHMFRQ